MPSVFPLLQHMLMLKLSTSSVYNFAFVAIETESLYTRVTQNILDRYGKTFEWSLKSRIMGRPPLLGAKMVVDSLQLPLEPQVFLDELHEKLDAEFPHASLMPGTYVHMYVCTHYI